MVERNIKRGVTGATLMALILSAVSCGGGAASNDMQEHFLSEMSVRGPKVDGESSAEARHFEAYRQYLLSFD